MATNEYKAFSSLRAAKPTSKAKAALRFVGSASPPGVIKHVAAKAGKASVKKVEAPPAALAYDRLRRERKSGEIDYGPRKEEPMAKAKPTLESKIRAGAKAVNKIKPITKLAAAAGRASVKKVAAPSGDLDYKKLRKDRRLKATKHTRGTGTLTTKNRAISLDESGTITVQKKRRK